MDKKEMDKELQIGDRILVNGKAGEMFGRVVDVRDNSYIVKVDYLTKITRENIYKKGEKGK